MYGCCPLSLVMNDILAKFKYPLQLFISFDWLSLSHINFNCNVLPEAFYSTTVWSVRSRPRLMIWESQTNKTLGNLVTTRFIEPK